MTTRSFTPRSMNRRTLLGATGLAGIAATLAACGGGSGGGASDGGGAGSGTTMRLALNQTETHPSYIALDNFGTALEESTGGAWGIDVFPNETLGAQQETLQMASNGSVEMSIVSGTQLENLNPDFLTLNMPGAFDNIEKQMEILQDPSIVGELFASLEESQNITVLGGFTQGERSAYSTVGPISTPADLSGQKMRVQESDLHLAMAAALGATGTPLAYGEVYTGLNSGVIDAAENNEISYFTQAHYEVAPYFSFTRHLVGTDYLIINTETLNSMSEEDRTAFDEGWAAAVQEHTGLWVEQTEQAIADAEADGATFNEVDTAAFQEALAALPEEFLTAESQTALWDAVRGAQG
ncbi:MAG: TRAP transporter substrate-binding protein [Brachybacterium sp.]